MPPKAGLYSVSHLTISFFDLEPKFFENFRNRLLIRNENIVATIKNTKYPKYRFVMVNIIKLMLQISD